MALSKLQSFGVVLQNELTSNTLVVLEVDAVDLIIAVDVECELSHGSSVAFGNGFVEEIDVVECLL